MPDPTPIRGRWWLVMLPNGAPYAIRPTRKSAEEYARNLGREYGVVDVVPVPDEQAIERAARAMYERGYPEDVRESWEAYAARQPDIAGRFRESVRAVLAAALEQPE